MDTAVATPPTPSSLCSDSSSLSGGSTAGPRGSSAIDKERKRPASSAKGGLDAEARKPNKNKKAANTQAAEMLRPAANV
eukprot:13571379-Alexandrium_andersonii.AAC.1